MMRHSATDALVMLALATLGLIVTPFALALAAGFAMIVFACFILYSVVALVLGKP